MIKLTLLVDRLRLTADIWLHRHGPWWPLLLAWVLVLVSLMVIAIPRLAADLAGKQLALKELQARADRQPAPVAEPDSTSEANYRSFLATLAEEKDVLASVEAILDSAASHHLTTTHVEYLPGHDGHAQAGTVQMTVPVSGNYPDVRRWIEEVLGTQAFVAVNELGFKREEIGLNQIEARVRLTLWHASARSPLRAGGMAASAADP